MIQYLRKKEDQNIWRDLAGSILIDSWYTSKEILASANTKGYKVIGGLKSNRTFKLREKGPKHSLSAYARNLRNASFDEIIVDGVAYLVRRIDCWISGA